MNETVALLTVLIIFGIAAGFITSILFSLIRIGWVLAPYLAAAIVIMFVAVQVL